MATKKKRKGLTMQKAAELIGCALRTVFNMRERGELKWWQEGVGKTATVFIDAESAKKAKAKRKSRG